MFDAAARHLSFTKAADDLAVTPAAVGQQIRALEETLGVVLFRRTARGLELTPEAERGLPALRSGFLDLEEAVRQLQAGQASSVLSVASTPAALAKWLAPRLHAYAAGNPGLSIRVTATDEPIDFAQANHDLALTWGAPPDQEGVHGRPLAEETLVIVAAPALGEAALGLRLIEAPESGWTAWLAANGRAGATTLSLPDAAAAIDAAAAGLGAARVPNTLAAADIAAGRLVALGEPIPIDAAFWLCAATPQWRQPKVRALVAHLLGG